MRTVPTALQAHLDSGATTVTFLFRIAPVVEGYDVLGITLLDRNVPYDDGDGEVTYQAPIGMVPANLQSSEQMDVDNAELQHLIPEPEYGLPITEAMLAAGAYDYAEYSLYLVNYEDLTMGHAVLGHGQLGQMRIQDGLQFWSELTALSKRLKQSIVEKDSLTCRATFGSQYPGTSGAVVEERFPCGFDAESLYVDFTVTSVGLETTRTFTASALGAADNAYVPGMVRWVTGANAGRDYEVEEQAASGEVSLTFETMFPIAVGDTGRIRPDCTKWKEAPNGCKTFWGADWVLHYRGEPYIPISDADQLNTPGATVGAGLGGWTTVPVENQGGDGA